MRKQIFSLPCSQPMLWTLMETKLSKGLRPYQPQTTASKKFLPSATINVLDAKDSTLVSFGRSKENGSFEIGRLAVGKYLLLVTYTGFEKVQKQFSISRSS